MMRVEGTRTTSSWSAREARPAGGDRGPRAAAPRTALVCKSLFGKAHTVMAEGGIAAAMGNV